MVKKSLPFIPSVTVETSITKKNHLSSLQSNSTTTMTLLIKSSFIKTLLLKYVGSYWGPGGVSLVKELLCSSSDSASFGDKFALTSEKLGIGSSLLADSLNWFTRSAIDEVPIKFWLQIAGGSLGRVLVIGIGGTGSVVARLRKFLWRERIKSSVKL
jgi:hypothetical protein